jgi:hypothetical protein
MSNLNGFFEELMRPPVRHDYARIQAEARRALERSARRHVVAAAAKRAKERRLQRRIKRAMIKESRHRAILRNDWPPEYDRLVRHPNHVPGRRSPSPNIAWNYRSPSLSLNFGGSLPPRSQSTQGTPPAVRHYARATPSQHRTQVLANVPESPPPRRYTQ